MRRDRARRRSLLAAERRRVPARPHGGLRVAVVYPNTYRVAMSSLAFQWVTELTAAIPDVGVERAVADPGLAGRTLETGTPLAEMDVVAFSWSFELDAPGIVRVLRDAGIPERAAERGPHHPLVAAGGSMATINPLPVAPALDVVCLGAAERLWPQLLEAVREIPGRDRLLDDLAGREGYLVPSRHLAADGRVHRRLRRLERRDIPQAPPAAVPASHIVTQHTEYAGRGVIEMSRGCPEKCRYCWISYNAGALKAYPADSILARVDELAAVTHRIGFIATAVGDHPEIAAILEACRGRGLEVALSSLRIPALVPEVLEPLAASGARSVTIAPETGSDRLRRALKKPIPNERILEGVAAAGHAGLSGVKMYFLLGLPGEEDADADAIADLAAAALARLRDAAGPGRPTWVRLGVSVLVPKPYTPYSTAGMAPEAVFRRRLQRLKRRLRETPGIDLEAPSYREALWQCYLSRAGADAFELVLEAASGEPLGRILQRHRERVRALAAPWTHGRPPWHFVSSAPSPASPPEPAGEHGRAG